VPRTAQRTACCARSVSSRHGSGASADTDADTRSGAAPEGHDGGHADRVLAVLGHEAMAALLACGRTAEARDVLETVPPRIRERGRCQLLRAQLLLAQDDVPAARAVFDAGFEVADLPADGEALEETWYAVAERLVAGDGPVSSEVRVRARAEHPLPQRYDYRVRPDG
jgi:outer membrane PBP1 activator LpoA protein